MSLTKPPILVLPRTALYQKLFNPSADARLREMAAPRFNDGEAEWSTEQLSRYVDGNTEVLITGWGSPKLTDAVLDRAPNLKLVAHSAGSVKFMLDEKLLERGIKVSTAGAAMVRPVSEMTVMLCLLMLRPIHEMDAAMRAGGTWTEMKVAGVGDELASQTVGVIGAGQIGKRVIQLLRAWDVAVNVFDPFYTAEQAAGAGTRKCGTLNELMACSRIVTLHAPILPDTRHMIGREQLAQMRDGSILINTARAWLVDYGALEAELRAGRLRCATDVFDVEPLPLDDRWRSMPNVLVTPHIASYTRQCFHRQGDITLDEIERFVAGAPLKYEVTPEAYKIMA